MSKQDNKNEIARDEKNIGHISQITSSVVDVEFKDDAALPPILTALECDNQGEKLIYMLRNLFYDVNRT